MSCQLTDARRPHSNPLPTLTCPATAVALPEPALRDEHFHIYGLSARNNCKIRKVYRRENGKWKDSFNPGTHFDCGVTPVPTLPEYADHLTKLRYQPHKSRIVGRLKKELREGGEWENRRHKKANFEDAETVWFEFDIDGYDCREIAPDFDIYDTANDPEELERVAEEIIEKHFHECFRDCSFVYRLTSSSGLKGERHEVRLRLIFQTTRPLWLAEQARIAVAINEDAGGKLCDPCVYQVGRFLLTADGHLSELRKTSPSNFDWVDVPQPINLDARYVERESETVDVPQDLIDNAPASQKRRGKSSPRAVRSPKVQSDAPLPPIWKRIQEIEDGYTDPPIQSMVGQIGRMPSMRRPYALAALSHHASARIREVAETPERVERRIRKHASLPALKDKLARFRRDKGAGEDTDAVPFDGGPELPIEQARAALPALFEEALKQDGATLIKIPAGVGKSEAALRSLLPWPACRDQRVVYLSPTNELSAQLRERGIDILLSSMDEQSLLGYEGDFGRDTVRHLQGLPKLCQRLGKPEGRRAELLASAGISPHDAVCLKCYCHPANGGNCAWPPQRDDAGPGFVFGQHGHLTTTLANIPEDSLKAPNLLVIDESFFQVLINAQKTRWELDKLRPSSELELIRNSKTDSVLIKRTSDLKAYRAELQMLLARTEGVLRTDEIGVLAEDGLDGVTRARSALSSEHWHRQTLFRELEAKNDDGEEARAIVDAIQLSRFISKIYKAILQGLDIPERETVFGVVTYEEKGVKKVRCRLKAPLPEIAKTRKLIILDASGDRAIYEAALGVPITVLDMKVAPGAYHLTQFVNRPFGKSMFLEGKGEQAHANIQQLRRYIWAQAYRHNGRRSHECEIAGRRIDVLVIASKDVETRLCELSLPSNVEVRHFSAIRGLDTFKDVPCLIVCGRDVPGDDILEELTEALHYDRPEVPELQRSDNEWKPGSQVIRMADGSARIVPREEHPDPHVEAVRHQIADQEVKQAIARVRIFDRTPERRVDIHVFGQTDTGLPAHEVGSWEEVRLDLIDLQMCRGMVFKSQDTVARVYGEALTGTKGGRMREAVGIAWWQAENMLHCPTSYIEPYIETGTTNGIFRKAQFRLATATPSGRRSPLQQAFIDTTRHIDAVRAIEAATGVRVEDFGWVDEIEASRKRGRPPKQAEADPLTVPASVYPQHCAAPQTAAATTL